MLKGWQKKWIVRILKVPTVLKTQHRYLNKGEVEVFERDYKAFTTGKSNTEGHIERIFYCGVTK